MSIKSIVTSPLLNALLFQAIWFNAALGQSSTWAVGLLLIGLHLHLHLYRINEVKLILLVSLVGIVIDTSLSVFDIISFNDGRKFIPVWLIILWAGFACTLNHSLKFLFKRLWIAGFLGALFGPLSYYGGSQFDGLQWSDPLYTGITFAIIWLLLLPSLIWITRRVMA